MKSRNILTGLLLALALVVVSCTPGEPGYVRGTVAVSPTPMPVSMVGGVTSNLTADVFNSLAKENTAFNAVIAAQIAAAKVDLFNSAEVLLFPDTTDLVITLTSGNTNSFSDWSEVIDENALTFSSKFATKAGYINDMYIYDHSAVDKLYLLELAYGGNKTMLARVMYHTSFIEMAPIKSRRVPAGETIYYRLMCSGANNATAKVGFRYFYE